MPGSETKQSGWVWLAYLREFPHHGLQNHPPEAMSMITATVRYKLPQHIDYAACRAHFHKIAPGFREAKGLISKHFIWSESGWAGGVYQWERIEDAKAFYSGPWLDGIVERYGMKPQIEFYEVFALTDNARGKVELFREDVPAK
jgi:hypothetical protein